MSKQFALIRNATRINDYLSRERYQLNKMQENPNVSSSLFKSKVRQFNELVASVNDLYRLASDEVAESVFDAYVPGEGVGDLVAQTSYVAPPVIVMDAAVAEDVPAPTTVDPEPEPEPPTPLGGQLDVEESKQRAAGVLDEYSNTMVEDIADYDPEEHESPSVMPTDAVDADVDEATSYMTHTNGVRLNSDPTQITDVKTAVEEDGEEGKKSVELPVDTLFTKEKSDFGDFINLDEEMASHRSRLAD